MRLVAVQAPAKLISRVVDHIVFKRQQIKTNKKVPPPLEKIDFLAFKGKETYFGRRKF